MEKMVSKKEASMLQVRQTYLGISLAAWILSVLVAVQDLKREMMLYMNIQYHLKTFIKEKRPNLPSTEISFVRNAVGKLNCGLFR
jgi:hypothetical protein